MRLSRACAAASCAAIATGGMAATALAASGGIQTVAGTGTPGTVSTGLAITSQLDTPSDVVALPDGGFLVADTANSRIRAVTSAGAVSTLSGWSTPSVAAALGAPLGLAREPRGDILISDGNRVMRLSGGTLSRVAGDANAGSGGDGGAALSARLDVPAGIAVLPSGGFVVADMGNNRIRRVERGRITTVAGRGTAGFAGDGGPATDAELRLPADVAVLADGDLLVADMGNDRIRRVDDATGTISTVAGGGADDREGIPATQAALPQPRAVMPTADGGFAVSVAGAHRVRHVAPDGTIVTIAGTGAAGSSGDGGPGTAATLAAPSGLGVTAGGRLLIADRAAHRVRALDAGLAAPGEPGSSRPASDDSRLPGLQPTSGDAPAPGPAPGSQPAPGGESSSGDGTSAGPATGAPELASGPAADAAAGTGAAPGAPVPSAGPAAGRTSDPVAPELGRKVVVAPASGTVLVRRPGARSATPLAAGEEIPVGSLIDARRGTVALTSALPGGATQTGRFSAGRFSVGQPAGAKGMTELTLRGPELGACRPTSPNMARTAARRKPARRLWGEDKGGRFRTRGRNSVATVRGTRWLTEDTCAGTRTRVLEGAVDVFDPARGITRRVVAGASLLVRPAGR